MRDARLVGLSPDGRFVIVATETGEELAIAADDRLRAAVRGEPAATKKLEIQMESALSPREIQTRIRSGESVEDVARVAGVDRERVERFAAPVIAEREHVAGLAMMSSARRRGETSAHRTLRGALAERLLPKGVDIDSVAWDSHRLDDGRWSVTADYAAGETARQAVFYFDVAGRYSVAGNDEGRWVLGDVPPARGAESGALPPLPGEQAGDTEPTVDLSDELALIRAIQDVPPVPRAGEGPPTVVEVTEFTEVDVTIAEVVQFSRVAKSAPAADAVEAETDSPADVDALDDGASGLDVLNDIFTDQDPLAGHASELGPSDASAVPELSPSLLSEAWEPAIVVDYPVEPSEDHVDSDVEVPEGSDDPGRPEPAVAGDDRRDEATSLLHTVLFGDPPADPVEVAEPASAEPAPALPTEPEEQLLPLDLPEQPPVATPPKPVRRKRASVPSWDEIVFGGPKEK